LVILRVADGDALGSQARCEALQRLVARLSSLSLERRACLHAHLQPMKWHGDSTCLLCGQRQIGGSSRAQTVIDRGRDQLEPKLVLKLCQTKQQGR
jgi:hypothetical protein